MRHPDVALINLNKTIDLASYTEMYKSKGLHRINSLEELSTLPFTTKQELRAAYPFGGLAQPMLDVVEVHTSSGSTGKAAVSFFTKKDIEEGNREISKAWVEFGISNLSRVMFIMSYGLYSGAALNTYAIQHTGAFVLPAGIQPMPIQLDLMINFKIDTIVATPGFLLYLYDYLVQNNIPKESLSLKRAIAAGEVYSEAIRKEIENKLDIEVFDHYGLCEVNTGIAYECKHHDGLHVLDDYVIPEIIDPVTGQVLEHGEFGELVLTSLKKEASPIIRYRTGDITRIMPGTCKCCSHRIRIDRIKGRVSDTLFVKGIKIDPYELRDIILSKFGDELNTRDMIIEHKENDIKYTPKIYLSMKGNGESKDVVQKFIRDQVKINMEIIDVDVDYFGRRNNTKVKLVKYVK